MQSLMGVIDFYNTGALCWVKSNANLKQQVGLAPRPICSFEGNNQRKFVAMASTVPVEQVNNGPLQVTGDSFIREHLRKLAPYQPNLPFEVCVIKSQILLILLVTCDYSYNTMFNLPEVFLAIFGISC